MSTRIIKRLLREGSFLAEVDIQVTDLEGSWSPVMSLEEAFILDDIREALRRGDVKQAAHLGQIFMVTPLAS